MTTRFRFLPIFCVLLISVLGSCFPCSVQGQGIMRVVPPPHYFDISLWHYHKGEFTQALSGFENDLQNCVKIPNQNGQMVPWLDSMCFWVMIGECHFQMARYEEAMNAFNTALDIYRHQVNWLKAINYVSGPLPVDRPALPWGTSKRPGGVGNFSQCVFQIVQEHVNVVDLKQHGTAIARQRQLTRIHADELIIRMALLIRRRAEILGPLSKFDQRTKELTEILGGRPCPPNHFTGVWVEVLYGLALAAMGDDTAAKPQLEKGLMMQGRFDHQLTSYALNELGNIAMRSGKSEAALQLYHETSLCATYFGDWALLGESFRNMSNAQKLIDKSKPLPPLIGAMEYLQGLKDPSPLVFVPVCHELAEDALTAADLKLATTFCNQASASMSKRAISDSVHGARNRYLRAIISYAQGIANFRDGKPLSVAGGDENLAIALGFLRRGSLWLYQLGVLETYFQAGLITTRGPITIRIADELYEYMLREPTSFDWATSPMDSLALMTFTPPNAYQRWFFVALQRGDREKAFNISELARRARFYSSFKLGPRLLSLRLLFEGNPNEIDPQALLQRQTLALDFTHFNQLSKRVAEIKKQLQALPVAPKDQLLSRQKTLLAELEQYSLAQEALLRPIALSRYQAPNVFPPIKTLEQIRAELPEKTSMLVFTEALGKTYGFLVNQSNLAMWPVLQEPRAPTLGKLITDFLEAIGNRDATRMVSLKDLNDSDTKWKKAGYDLLIRLLGESRQANFTELVIVPTGPLWYVPFEAMSVKIGDEYRPLISAADSPLTIRYAPMASLGVPAKMSRSVTAETLVLHGKLFAKDDPSVALDAINRYIKEGVEHLVPMTTIGNEPNFQDLPASASAFATQVKRLVVLDDIPMPRSGEPLAWSPFTFDKSKLNNPIGSWMNLPWGGPETIVLPGFHTPAESALKSTGSSAASRAVPSGDDLFLSSMVLQACGAKTILISRWRSGGRASYDLVGDFLKNYETMPASEAWRKSIINVGVTPLTLKEEPRIRSHPTDKAPLANHPFFWGAFALIDRGEHPESAEEDATEKESKLD